MSIKADHPSHLESSAIGEFSVGDVVTLQSGSPPLTVHSVNLDTIKCIWFGTTGPLTHEFPKGVLKKGLGPDHWAEGIDSSKTFPKALSSETLREAFASGRPLLDLVARNDPGSGAAADRGGSVGTDHGQGAGNSHDGGTIDHRGDPTNGWGAAGSSSDHRGGGHS